jgi:hypothetical protein
MTKRMTVGILAALLLLSPMEATADDPKPAAPVAAVAAVAEPTAPVAETPKADSKDPVADAAKKIDEAISTIEENPVESVSTIVQAFKDGRWAAGIGLAIMFLIWILRKFIWKLIPKKVLPWLTLGLGCTVTVAVELITGVIWWQTLIDGFLASASAMALWTLIFKHVLPSADDEKKPA